MECCGLVIKSSALVTAIYKQCSISTHRLCAGHELLTAGRAYFVYAWHCSANQLVVYVSPEYGDDPRFFDVSHFVHADQELTCPPITLHVDYKKEGWFFAPDFWHERIGGMLWHERFIDGDRAARDKLAEFRNQLKIDPESGIYY